MSRLNNLTCNVSARLKLEKSFFLFFMGFILTLSLENCNKILDAIYCRCFFSYCFFCISDVLNVKYSLYFFYIRMRLQKVFCVIVRDSFTNNFMNGLIDQQFNVRKRSKGYVFHRFFFTALDIGFHL